MLRYNPVFSFEGMSYQLETSSSSDEFIENNTINPRYTMEEYIAEQSVLYTFLERNSVKLQEKWMCFRLRLQIRREKT
jgi:hypothetical protein